MSPKPVTELIQFRPLQATNHTPGEALTRPSTNEVTPVLPKHAKLPVWILPVLYIEHNPSLSWQKISSALEILVRDLTQNSDGKNELNIGFDDQVLNLFIEACLPRSDALKLVNLQNPFANRIEKLQAVINFLDKLRRKFPTQVVVGLSENVILDWIVFAKGRIESIRIQELMRRASAHRYAVQSGLLGATALGLAACSSPNPTPERKFDWDKPGPDACIGHDASQSLLNQNSTLPVNITPAGVQAFARYGFSVAENSQNILIAPPGTPNSDLIVDSLRRQIEASQPTAQFGTLANQNWESLWTARTEFVKSLVSGGATTGESAWKLLPNLSTEIAGSGDSLTQELLGVLDKISQKGLDNGNSPFQLISVIPGSNFPGTPAPSYILQVMDSGTNQVYYLKIQDLFRLENTSKALQTLSSQGIEVLPAVFATPTGDQLISGLIPHQAKGFGVQIAKAMSGFTPDDLELLPDIVDAYSPSQRLATVTSLEKLATTVSDFYSGEMVSAMEGNGVAQVYHDLNGGNTIVLGQGTEGRIFIIDAEWSQASTLQSIEGLTHAQIVHDDQMKMIVAQINAMRGSGTSEDVNLAIDEATMRIKLKYFGDILEMLPDDMRSTNYPVQIESPDGSQTVDGVLTIDDQGTPRISVDSDIVESTIKAVSPGNPKKLISAEMMNKILRGLDIFGAALDGAFLGWEIYDFYLNGRFEISYEWRARLQDSTGQYSEASPNAYPVPLSAVNAIYPRGILGTRIGIANFLSPGIGPTYNGDILKRGLSQDDLAARNFSFGLSQLDVVSNTATINFQMPRTCPDGTIVLDNFVRTRNMDSLVPTPTDKVNLIKSRLQELHNTLGIDALLSHAENVASAKTSEFILTIDDKGQLYMIVYVDGDYMTNPTVSLSVIPELTNTDKLSKTGVLMIVPLDISLGQ